MQSGFSAIPAASASGSAAGDVASTTAAASSTAPTGIQVRFMEAQKCSGSEKPTLQI